MPNDEHIEGSNYFTIKIQHSIHTVCKYYFPTHLESLNCALFIDFYDFVLHKCAMRNHQQCVMTSLRTLKISSRHPCECELSCSKKNIYEVCLERPPTCIRQKVLTCKCQR